MKQTLTCSLLILLTTICQAATPPDIIMILIDDMGYSDLGAYGGEVKTPAIDHLAKNGLRFTQTYNSARCCPTRASLLTGLYSHQAGIANFTGKNSSQKMGPAYLGKLNKSCVTLAEVLKTAGYSTYGVGKWHVGREESPVKRGFDEYYGYTQGHSSNQWKIENYHRMPKDRKPEISFDKNTFYATDAFSDYAMEFIRQGQKKEKPYFLYLAHSSPHFPIQAPAATRDKYLDTYRRGWDVLRKERYERQKKSGLATSSWKFTERSQVPSDSDKIANGYAGKQNPAWESLPKDRREDLAYRMATFAAMIDHVDKGIARIIDHLKKTGDLKNTLIILTSDNGACYEWGPFGFDKVSRRGINILHKGEILQTVGGRETHHSVGSAWSGLSNTPLRMYKHFNHEGGNCSPMIIHWPKGVKKEDRWIRNPAHVMDIMPTLCDAAGAKYPKKFNGKYIIPMEGRSLLPHMKGKRGIKERTLCFDHFDSSAIRKGDWKLVRGNRRYNNRKWELYNIGEDRCETRDLITELPDKAKELEKLWLEWAVRIKVSPYYKHPQ